MEVRFATLKDMQNENSGKRDYVLPASILIAALMISGSIVYLVGSRSGGGPAAAPGAREQGTAGAPVAIKTSDRDVILGDPKAPVTLIEYGDYQCPFCARFFTETESRLREEYIKTGKVKMVFRNFQFLGPESFAAGEAAECAKDQKQFWAFHDALYTAEHADGQENNGNLNRALFVSIASSLKLDAKSFAACIDGKKYASQVQKDSDGGRAVGVNSTPTSFVNGRLVAGALPFEQFKALIESALTGS